MHLVLRTTSLKKMANKLKMKNEVQIYVFKKGQVKLPTGM